MRKIQSFSFITFLCIIRVHVFNTMYGSFWLLGSVNPYYFIHSLHLCFRSIYKFLIFSFFIICNVSGGARLPNILKAGTSPGPHIDEARLKWNQSLERKWSEAQQNLDFSHRRLFHWKSAETSFNLNVANWSYRSCVLLFKLSKKSSTSHSCKSCAFYARFTPEASASKLYEPSFSTSYCRPPTRCGKSPSALGLLFVT